MATPNAYRVAARHLEAARFTMPRTSYLPPAVRDTEPNVDADGSDLAIWTWEEGGKLYGIAFAADQSKPLWNYRFPNESVRQNRIKETIADRKSVLESKAKRLQERKEFQHGLVVGDLLYTSWGYDQTQSDFYEVTAVVGKSVLIREVAAKVVKSDGSQDYVVAVPGHYVGPAAKKIPQGNGGFLGGVSVKINSVATAWKWDGKPKAVTGFGYGH